MARKTKRAGGIPREEAEAFLRLAAQYDVVELEVAWSDNRIRIRRQGVGPSSPNPAPPAPTETAEQAVTRSSQLLTIEAPMVGTFYRASSPDASPYVNEGDPVKEGQILCIIEAMKLMNEIESKAAGRVVKILVENGQPVEYGQPLFLVEPRP
jgi:acetyl-CoA carboxylase biotin carboxyl carrier protein